MKFRLSLILSTSLSSLQSTDAWTASRLLPITRDLRQSRLVLASEKSDDEIERTSFDDAGKSLIEQEDQKRLEQMGDFDSLGSQDESVARMRTAIRERAAGLNIEKSKVSAEYIAQKQQAAQSAGPPGAQKSEDVFGGLDLSQISDTKSKNTGSDWNEEMPSMLYDPEAELTKEEQEEADPLMVKNPIEQAMYEISQAKWPTTSAAIRDIVIMFGVIALTTVVIVGWDQLLRQFYTGVGFIPNKEDLANYASRFDGLDLPQGWMDGMNEQDIQQFSEKVNSVAPDIAPAVSDNLPSL